MNDYPPSFWQAVEKKYGKDNLESMHWHSYMVIILDEMAYFDGFGDYPEIKIKPESNGWVKIK